MISQVLVPCSIDFNLSAKEGESQRISVDLPELVLNISPETVKILSAVAQTLAPPKVGCIFSVKIIFSYYSHLYF